MKKSRKDKQLENLLFEVYEKGVNNEDCDLTTYIKKIKKALSAQRVKILDQGNGDCGLITDEILEHYKKENYFEKGDLLYSCGLIKTY